MSLGEPGSGVCDEDMASAASSDEGGAGGGEREGGITEGVGDDLFSILLKGVSASAVSEGDPGSSRGSPSDVVACCGRDAPPGTAGGGGGVLGGGPGRGEARFGGLDSHLRGRAIEDGAGDLSRRGVVLAVSNESA